ncbi:MAG: ABC transporter permease [Actinomycetota bacterium]
MTATLHEPSTPAVIAATVRRTLLRVRRMPAAFVPSMVMPVFQLIAFSGAFGAAVKFAGIKNAMDWYVPLNAVQGASFGAMGVSFGLINDMQTGFFDRLLMAPTKRWSLVVGPMAGALVRAALPIVLVFVVGFIGGMNVPGGPMAFVTIVIAAIGIALVAAAFALGLTFRMRNMGAATLTQFAVFFTIFLSTSQVPLAAMSGWLHAVARVNPMTNVLRLARQGLLGDVTWSGTWGGLVALGGMLVASTWFALSGLKSLEK